MKKFSLLFFFAVFSLGLSAQVTDADRELALQLVRDNSTAIGLAASDVDNSIVSGTYVVPGSDLRMVYLQQSYQGIPVYNRLHVLAFRNGKAVSVAGERIAAIEQKTGSGNSRPAVDAVQAVRTALADVSVAPPQSFAPVSITREGRKYEFTGLGISSEKVFSELLWFPMQDGEVRLVWQVFVAPLNNSSYWLIRVDAKTNEVVDKEDMTISCNWGDPQHDNEHKSGPVSITNTGNGTAAFVAKREMKQVSWQYRPLVINTASYRVIRYPAESPIHPGGAPQLVTDPWTMSPGNATTHGWHFDGFVHYDSTRGNNAFAYEDRDANNQPGYAGLSSTPQPGLTFNFVPDFSLEPVVRTPAPNQQFNTTNLFYWNNLMHDLSYLYGFTETARNYQNDNMGRGGVGNDYVLAEAQDGSGVNNANFSSGIEGTRGRMQMYLWTAPTPDRDGDVDNGIIAHEYGHGISNRMTGTGAGCLSVVEQMGEGWSDYYALMITHDWATATPTQGFNNPRGIGTYALNQPITGQGIRQYRYTTNMAVNPLTYANLPGVAVPHGVGTIWCTALWDMTWYIIQQAGINPNLFNPAGAGGNSVALKLVQEGLRLQPCNPGFIDGRNAILKADTLFFGAQYSCAIWEAFARRGMGIGASQGSPAVRGDETISFVNAAPNITQQPQNATVCSGSNHTFSITATGMGVTYQWQVSTDGGATYNNISGATAASYTLTGVTLAMNNNRYRCIASGCTPAVTSNAATLTVVSSPAITSQPSNSAVCENQNTSFTVGTSGSGLTYQWQLSTDGGANYNNISNGGVYSGATTNTLSITGVTPSMNGYRYRAVITSAGCGTPSNSSAATLSVNALLSITAQPQDAAICSGSNHTFSVSTSGGGAVYQWQLSTDGGFNYSNISGATSSTYTVSAATTGMNGYRYRVVVSNTCSPPANSTPAVLSVAEPATVTLGATSTETCSGSNISLAGSASGATSLQWQVNTGTGFTNISDGNIGNGAAYGGTNTATLSITNAQVGMSSYQYRLQVSNSVCTTPVNSASVTLTVRQLPSVTLAAAPLTVLMPGQTTTLTAAPTASTGGTLSVSWLFNGNAVPNAGSTRTVNVEQVGTYRVTISEAWPGNLTCSNQSQQVVISTEASTKLFIFPSPNGGRFTVSYYNSSGGNARRTITVFDSKGAKVYNGRFAVTGSYTLLDIDLRPAQRGAYYVVVGDQTGQRLADGKVLVH